MCNISDKRDNKPIYEIPHFLDTPLEDKNVIDPNKSKHKHEFSKRNTKTMSSPGKMTSEIEVGEKVTSVVKSSKVGGTKDQEETAHFVFFDMED